MHHISVPLAVSNLPLQLEVEDADAVVSAGDQFIAQWAEHARADRSVGRAGVSGNVEDFLTGAGVKQPHAVHGACRQRSPGRGKGARQDAAALSDGADLRAGGDLEDAARQLARRRGELAAIRREVGAQHLALVAADGQLALQGLRAQNLGSLVRGCRGYLAAVRREGRVVDSLGVDAAALQQLPTAHVEQRQRSVRRRRQQHWVALGAVGREERALGLLIVREAVHLLARGHVGDQHLAVARARGHELAGGGEGHVGDGGAVPALGDQHFHRRQWAAAGGVLQRATVTTVAWMAVWTGQRRGQRRNRLARGPTLVMQRALLKLPLVQSAFSPAEARAKALRSDLWLDSSVRA